MILGGVLTTGGAVIVDHLKTQRDQQRAAKERLRENLCVLLDDMSEVIEQFRVSVDALSFGTDVTDDNHGRLNTVILRVGMQTVKIEDAPLQRLMIAWLDILQ